MGASWWFIWATLGPRRGRARFAEVGPGARVLGRVWVHGGGRIALKRNATLDGRALPIELFARAGALLEIGEEAHVAGGASLEATALVRIGRRARIGMLAKVLDNNFHAVHGDRHELPEASPVCIGEGASIGARAIVLPGSCIEPGVRVPADAVVTRCEPSDSFELEPLAAPRGFDAACIRAERALGRLRAELRFAGCAHGHDVYAGAPLDVVRRGTIELGSRVQFMPGPIATRLVAERGARLRIGAETHLNYGASIWAADDVVLGARCLVGSHARIGGVPGRSAPIEIGDDVWIAHGAKVAAGVRIGAGSVVGAAAEVREDVPPRSLAFGRPLRCLPLDSPESLRSAG